MTDMKFNSSVKLVAGNAIPTNSIALLYSPHCGHCHKMVPQFNGLRDALTAGGVTNIEIVAVDVSQEFSSLRAGGISVPHVPLVLIKTPTSIIEYQGNRMATEIASEAAKVLAGGESVPTTVPETVPAVVPADALLGGAAEAIEGGKKRRFASGVDRSAGRVRKMHSVVRRSKKGKYSYFTRESSRRSRSSIRKSRRKRSMRGGEEAPVEGGEIEGGKNSHHLHRHIQGHYPSGVNRSKSRRSRKVRVPAHSSHDAAGKVIHVKGFSRRVSRHYSQSSIDRRRRRHPRSPYKSRKSMSARRRRLMKGGEEVPPVAGGETAPTVPAVPAVEPPIVGGDVPAVVEGGRKRRRSRRSRVRGGEAEPIEGGKKRRSKSRSRKSRTAWQRVMAAEIKKHSPTKAGFAAASRAASKKYHA